MLFTALPAIIVAPVRFITGPVFFAFWDQTTTATSCVTFTNIIKPDQTAHNQFIAVHSGLTTDWGWFWSQPVIV